MPVEFPAPIADYFSADRAGDAAAVASHFTEKAIVRDEDHDYVGRKAIHGWKAASSRKYAYTAEPYAVVEDAGTTIVTAHLTGDFPGSPLDLRYRFVVDGERIAALEIGA